MHPRSFISAHLLVSLAILVLAGCGGEGGNVGKGGQGVDPRPGDAGSPRASAPEPLRDEIASGVLAEVMKSVRAGLGLMEQYRYAEAAVEFRKVRELAPGWIPGSINLAIALLNDTGTKAEDAKQGGGDQGPGLDNFSEALALLDGVIARDPKNPHARFCRGIILKYLSGDPDHPDNIVRAHEDFQVVVDVDPADGHAWYKLGDSLYDPESVGSEFGVRPAGPRQAKQLVDYYTKAMERNPYLVSNLYQLQQALGWAGDRDRQQTILALWRKLNPQGNAAAPGDIVGNFYGDMGKYAQVINPFAAAEARTPPPESAPPRFEEGRPLAVELAPGDRWASPEDFQGVLEPLGKLRARFGAAVAALDADKDGKLDLYLAAAVVGPEGIHDCLLMNRGDGEFVDATRASGIPITRASLGVAAADFDADLVTDLFLTGLDGNLLLRGLAGGRFEDITAATGVAGKGVVGLTARWLDLDQDGDLDLYVLNHCKTADLPGAFGANPPPGVANAAFRNDGKPSAVAGRPADNWAPIGAATGDLVAVDGLSRDFTPWNVGPELLGAPASYSGIAAVDIDNDRDVDLLLLADDKPLTVVYNDRLGRFHAQAIADLPIPKRAAGLAAVDLDKDGALDLVAPAASGQGVALLARGTRTSEGFQPKFTPFPSELPAARTVLVDDLDLDTWPDLVLLAADSAAPRWARNLRDRLAPAVELSLGPDSAAGPLGIAFADLAGNPLPDLLIVRAGEAPRVSINRGNGRRWVALRLGGKWKTSFDHMRTNSEGLGTRLTLEGDGLLATYSHTVPDAALAQSSKPIVLGLGTAEKVALLHARWPDGVMQSELGVDADVVLPLIEYNRKTGSCPVLFTWNGTRFVCLGDFLGGGGLGYLVAPGVYSQPDRDEALAVGPDQLQPVDGRFRISITEPMDEVAYLDHLMLDVVDRPPGVETVLDERFAPEGPRPSGRLLAYRESITPARVVDHRGNDLTADLAAWDRRTADRFRKLRGWIGYAEPHSITLDFGDRLRRFGSTDRLVLALAGWVEYPYSQTNYAAATAGVALQPPKLERLQPDGTWATIDPSPGYPAGLPRMMSVDLTGKVGGDRCVLRISTNMECYWDQVFIAAIDDRSEIRVTSLAVDRAALGPRGYTREVSPDGRLPLLYDYDYVDPAPLAKLSGKLTRYGDVAELLQADDDRLCLIGPGDEARIEFDAAKLPPLPPGWTRTHVLRTFGYCKDADPSTATSDTIGPLPWRGMPEFPFAKPATRPLDPGYTDYLERYQTREVGSR
ncbi:MAG: FG-GAP-like repeat-containing protein [Isosphaeraceae bacterium]|nr:FG-GAP-like repeat-containing protein [Isosphaeraceae bacterium]